MKGLLATLMLAIGLNACGYHLVGQGGGSGVIPPDATQIVIYSGQDNVKLTQLFRQKLAQSSELPVLRLQDATADENTVEIRIEHIAENMTASAFDTSGIANQYRVSVSASLRVLQAGKTLWESEAIIVSSDVFATGGAVAIEAQKERVVQALHDEWTQKAQGRLRSGF